MMPLALLSLLSPCAVLAQVPAEKVEATFSVSPGLEMSLWASEPLFSNPTCIDVDHKGRVWVCESVNYRDTLRHRPLRRPQGDRILILEDSHQTGRADKVTTFYQSPALLAPLGIAVAKEPSGSGYKVYVCQSPDILLFEDKDGDGKADGPPRKLLSGFRGIDHDHGVHGILIGPDSKLYFSVGDQGVDGLPGRAGKRWKTNHTDCQGGTIWRCDLDGRNLELIAHNFRNEYEPCVDSFGTVFVSDNDDDGNQQTRICYVMPGGNYGYWPRGPGQSHWHEEQPGVVPKILRTYFGSPTGMCVYEGSLLPKEYRGQLLHTDAGPRHLRCYHLHAQGAGFAVQREDMVTTTDNWFRPSDVCVAPDGSLFIADWYDPGVGGHGMGDTKRGRIFRVAPPRTPYAAAQLDLQTDDGLLRALASPALSVRSMAMAKLDCLSLSRFLAVIDRAATKKDEPFLRARALWQLGRRYQASLALERSRDPRGAALLREAFQARIMKEAALDGDDRFRAEALRIVHDCGDAAQLQGFIKQLLHRQEASAAVRREALLCLRDLEAGLAKPLIFELARSYDGKDRFYLNAVGIAVGQEQLRRQVILADFEKEFPDWDDRVANLVWELRPPVALARLEKQVGDCKIPAAQRCRFVDILSGSADPEAGKTLVKLLARESSSAVRARIAEDLKQELPGKWRDLRSCPELTLTITALLHDPKTRSAALDLITAAQRREFIGEISAMIRDQKADANLRSEAARALGLLRTHEATAALGQLCTQSQLASGLRMELVDALGRQAQRRQNSSAPNEALKLLQDLASREDEEIGIRQGAVSALAGSRPGSLWLLDPAVYRKLPDPVRREAARLLRSAPYQDVRARAALAFPSASRLDPKKLPSPAALAHRKGDATRGQRLIAASLKSDLQCLKCHTIDGTGGKVGPDLSAIGKKGSRENLFESILFPNKAIADQYVSWLIGTKQGLIITGLIVEETADHITVRDANAKDTRIDKKDIDTREKSPNSLMPSDLLGTMTEDDLVDMVEYLYWLK
jgi:putative membrane-bound dehydrogenase-like protein